MDEHVTPERRRVGAARAIWRREVRQHRDGVHGLRRGVGDRLGAQQLHKRREEVDLRPELVAHHAGRRDATGPPREERHAWPALPARALVRRQRPARSVARALAARQPAIVARSISVQSAWPWPRASPSGRQLGGLLRGPCRGAGWAACPHRRAEEGVRRVRLVDGLRTEVEYQRSPPSARRPASRAPPACTPRPLRRVPPYAYDAIVHSYSPSTPSPSGSRLRIRARRARALPRHKGLRCCAPPHPARASSAERRTTTGLPSSK